MSKNFAKIAKAGLALTFGLFSTNAFADACSTASHSGTNITETANKTGTIGDIGYEIWFDSGNNSATFYSDGSFSCTFSNASDYLCRAGLSFNSDKTYSQLGHMYADFQVNISGTSNIGYSYIGIYGWTKSPLIEYYIVDSWGSQYRPGSWVGTLKGTFTIDGAEYDVYTNTRTNQPSIEGNATFTQFFSIRKEARNCGTIDITAHFEKWAELGMTLGNLYEAKVLGEAGTTSGGASGQFDFPYAKVYIGSPSSSSSSDVLSSSSSSNQTSIATGIAPIATSGSFQVFNALGNFMGTVEVKNGASISGIIFTKFGKPGVYLAKQGSTVKAISVKKQDD
ncbi:MAG: glycoside hydrolase family 11 protein [Fibrobacteraceae bacterium]